MCHAFGILMYVLFVWEGECSEIGGAIYVTEISHCQLHLICLLLSGLNSRVALENKKSKNREGAQGTCPMQTHVSCENIYPLFKFLDALQLKKLP